MMTIKLRCFIYYLYWVIQRVSVKTCLVWTVNSLLYIKWAQQIHCLVILFTTPKLLWLIWIIICYLHTANVSKLKKHIVWYILSITVYKTSLVEIVEHPIQCLCNILKSLWGSLFFAFDIIGLDITICFMSILSILYLKWTRSDPFRLLLWFVFSFSIQCKVSRGDIQVAIRNHRQTSQRSKFTSANQVRMDGHWQLGRLNRK